jgi:hypothetical protein
MTRLIYPSEVEAVFRNVRSCELATISKNGMPVAWPTNPLYMPETGRFLITASLGLSQKAWNIRRNPRVSHSLGEVQGDSLASRLAQLMQIQGSLASQALWGAGRERASQASISSTIRS